MLRESFGTAIDIAVMLNLALDLSTFHSASSVATRVEMVVEFR